MQCGDNAQSQLRFSAFCSALLRRAGSLFLFTVFWNQAISTLAGAAAALEYDVKAAFLFNFTKFVEWPPSAFTAPDSPLAICILGEDPFGRAIDQIVEGESVNGHKVTVERIRADQTRSCQVLYTDNSRPTSIVSSQGVAAVLTVGEGDEFIHEGGIVAFVIDNRRVRFDINLKAATNTGLKLSSKLLSVARAVEK